MKYFLLVLAISATGIAQRAPQYNDAPGKSRLGLSAGSDYTMLRGGFGQNYQPVVSYFSGISFEYRFADRFSVFTNANYDRQSFSQHYRSTVGTPGNYQSIPIRETLLFQYLNVPIMIRWYVGTQTGWYTNGGILCNYLLNRTSTTLNSTSGTGVSALQSDALFKKQVFGISLGGGHQFAFSRNTSLTLELRDDLGLSDLRTKSYNGNNTSTNSIKLVANYSFNIGKNVKNRVVQ